MGCILTAVVSCRTPANREVLQVKMGENKEDRRPQGTQDNKAKTVLMTIFLYSLFGCNGSVVVRAIIGNHRAREPWPYPSMLQLRQAVECASTSVPPFASRL